MEVSSEAIIERFPEYRDKILTQIGENEDFKCLCSDYGQCIQMLESFREKIGEVPSTLEEFLEIKIGLEQEVLKFLSK